MRKFLTDDVLYLISTAYTQ